MYINYHEKNNEMRVQKKNPKMDSRWFSLGPFASLTFREGAPYKNIHVRESRVDTRASPN